MVTTEMSQGLKERINARRKEDMERVVPINAITGFPMCRHFSADVGHCTALRFNECMREENNHHCAFYWPK